MKIALVTGNHLCHNPRVIKEASSLSAAGFRVAVLGGWSDYDLKNRDQALAENLSIDYRPVLDLSRTSRLKPILRLFLRATTRVGRIVHRILGCENTQQLGPNVTHLRRAIRELHADLNILHSEVAMAAAEPAASRPARIGIDMEDWFSEDLSPKDRKNRPLRLLRGLERRLLNRAVHASAPSTSMSLALSDEYDCRMPITLYNAFPWADRFSMDNLVKDRRNCSLPSIHWYSQTLGGNRGIEELLAALPLLQRPAEIHLRGQLSAENTKWLQSRIPERWQGLVFTHPLVSNAELLSRIGEHDIGFAGETRLCRSRDLTVTNKILHYLLGGLAVVASDTSGQREVASKAPEAVRLYNSGDPRSLAAALNPLLLDKAHLARARDLALKAAQRDFCWEKSSQGLLSSVEDALLKS